MQGGNRSMNQGVKKFNSIDLIKFIMSFLVVAIHTNPLKMCNIPAVTVLYDCITACAVPFFFLASGFLLAQKSTAENFPQIIKKHLFKIIKMYLIWSVLYLPLAVIHFWSEGESFLRSVLLYLRGFFIVGENYNSWMLWYLLSTIYALLFILFLVQRKIKLTHVLILGSILFAIGCVIPSFVGYTGSLPGVFSFFKKVLSVVVSGRIFKGFLYIPLGMVLAKKKPSALLGILFALSGFVGNVFLDSIPEDFVVALCSAGVFILVCHINLKDSAV